MNTNTALMTRTLPLKSKRKSGSRCSSITKTTVVKTSIFESILQGKITSEEIGDFIDENRNDIMRINHKVLSRDLFYNESLLPILFEYDVGIKKLEKNYLYLLTHHYPIYFSNDDSCLFDFGFQLFIYLTLLLPKIKNYDDKDGFYFCPNLLGWLVEEEDPEAAPPSITALLLAEGALSKENIEVFIKKVSGVNPSKPDRELLQCNVSKDWISAWLILCFFNGVLFVGDKKIKTHRQLKNKSKNIAGKEKYKKKVEDRPIFYTFIKNHFSLPPSIRTKRKTDDRIGVHRSIEGIFDFFLDIRNIAKEKSIAITQIEKYFHLKKWSKQKKKDILSACKCVPEIE